MELGSVKEMVPVTFVTLPRFDHADRGSDASELAKISNVCPGSLCKVNPKWPLVKPGLSNTGAIEEDKRTLSMSQMPCPRALTVDKMEIPMCWPAQASAAFTAGRWA